MIKNKSIFKNPGKLYSFDVFDTCLIRSCGKPSVVFYLMALELYGKGSDHGLIYDFVNSRLGAERRAAMALISSTKQDVSIREIYSYFNSAILDLFSIERLIHLELLIEDKVLRPIHSTKKEIESLHTQGKSVIFISDMYLPSSFIKRQLMKHGFWAEGDKLYVSNEAGYTKASGGLFDLISETENISFKAWRHYGDDKKNDYQVPKSKGITAKLMRDIHYSRYESEWINSATLSDNPLQGILMAGIARTIRLCSKKSDITDLVCDVVAPLFVPFIAGVLEDANKRGINRIYFLARDAYIFLQIAKTFGADYPNIKFSYLYASRRTLYLAGIEHGTKEEFRWIMGGAIGRTPRQMMKRINLDVQLLDACLDSFSIDQNFYDKKLTAEGFDLFLDLLTDENILPRILLEAKKQKEIALQYFEQEGLRDENSKIAIVDLGWTRTCQKSINSILGTADVFGYYFGVFKDRMFPDQAGQYMAGFYPEEIIWSEKIDRSLNSGFIAVAEQVFAMTNHGSTIGYKKVGNKIIPQLDEKENSDIHTAEYIKLLYDNIVMFSEEYSSFEWLMTNAKSAITTCGLNSLYLLIDKPDRKETVILEKFKVGNNLDDNANIITPISLQVLYQILKSKFNSLQKSPGFIWVQGSISFSFGIPGLQLFLFIRKMKQRLSA
jgi:predicted HAD superfamily hydrolase